MKSICVNELKTESIDDSSIQQSSTEKKESFRHCHGKIIEEGTHNNLLAQGSEYATLYNTYFKHQEVKIGENR